MEGAALEEARTVLAAFAIDGALVGLEPITQGHINASFVSSWRDGESSFRRFHQRMNREVFARPDLVMENIARATGHIRAGLAREGALDLERRVLRIVLSREGSRLVRGGDGEYWRCYEFIEGSRSLDLVGTPGEALEVGRGVGRFLRLLDGLPGPRLHEAIPRFHDAADRYRRFEEAVGADRAGRRGEVASEIEAFLGARKAACVLSEAVARGSVPERTVHNDCKANNILLDVLTGRALCTVDLDTVGPGSLLYDFGDLVRTAATTAREDEPNPERVDLDTGLFEALAEGFAEETRGLVTPAERALLPDAGKAFALVMGLRFLTDYLDGDRYYRVARPRHNLERARSQLALAEAFDRRYPELRRICERAFLQA